MERAIKSKSVFWILFMNVIGAVAATIIIAVGFGNIVSCIISLVVLVASLLYPIVMMSKMVNEINIICRDDGEHLMHYVLALLLGSVTLGIYYIYYLYRIQNRLYANKEKYNVAITEKGSSVVLWYLVGFITVGICTLIAISIPIRNFNKIAKAYNEQRGLITTDSHSAKKEIKRDEVEDKSTYKLSFIEGVDGDPALGGKVRLKGGEVIVIGRDPSVSHFVVKDSTVSRKHCSIRVSLDGQKIYVTDYSSNGTYVNNDQKLAKEVETAISKGDVIVLSKKTKFQIQ